jgi:hypothetical protein
MSNLAPLVPIVERNQKNFYGILLKVSQIPGANYVAEKGNWRYVQFVIDQLFLDVNV